MPIGNAAAGGPQHRGQGRRLAVGLGHPRRRGEQRQMPHGGAGSCSGSTDDRGELPRQQLRVRAGETRDVVQQSARQTTGFVVPQREADVEVGGGRFRFVCLDAQITTCSAGIVKSWRRAPTWGVDSPVDGEAVLDRGRGAVQRRDVEVAHLSQQPGERHPRFHPGAQDDGVH
ncbi:hypothetical protein GS448_26170, partial [Rhodococcus hoagii]|nr:hypothetical protein [Prescottella equi]